MYNTQSRYLLDSLVPVVKEPTIRKKKKKKKKPSSDKIAQLKKKYGKDFILQLLLLLLTKKEKPEKKDKNKSKKDTAFKGMRMRKAPRGRGAGGFQTPSDIKKQRDAAAKAARLAKAGELRPGETEEDRKERLLRATLSEADPTTALIYELSGAFNYRQSNYKGDEVSLAGQTAYANQLVKGLNEIRRKQGDASENQGELFLRQQRLEREALNLLGQFQGPTFDKIYDPATPRGRKRTDIVEGAKLGKSVVEGIMNETFDPDEMENAVKAVKKLAEEGLLFSDEDSDVEQVRPRGYRGPAVPGDTGETIPVRKKPKEAEETLDFDSDSPPESGAGVGLRPSPRTGPLRPARPPPVGELSSSSSSSKPETDLDSVATGVAEGPSFEEKLQDGKLTTQEVADHLDTIPEDDGDQIIEFFASIFNSYPKDLRPDDFLFKKYYQNTEGGGREYIEQTGIDRLYDLYLEVSGSKRRKPQPKRGLIQDVSQKRFGFADILEGAEARLLSLSKIPDTESETSDIELTSGSDETTSKFLDRKPPPKPLVPYTPFKLTTRSESEGEYSSGIDKPYTGPPGTRDTPVPIRPFQYTVEQPFFSDGTPSSATETGTEAVEETVEVPKTDTEPEETEEEKKERRKKERQERSIQQKKLTFSASVDRLEFPPEVAEKLNIEDEKEEMKKRLFSSIDSGNNTAQYGRLLKQIEKMTKRVMSGKSMIDFGIDTSTGGIDDKKNPRFSHNTRIQPNKDAEGNKILYEYIDTETGEVYRMVDFYPQAQEIMELLATKPSAGLQKYLKGLDQDFKYNLRDEITGEAPGKPGYSNNKVDTLSDAEDAVGKKLPKVLRSVDDPRRLKDTSSVISYGNKGITIQNESGYLTFVPFTEKDKPPKEPPESSDVPADLEQTEQITFFTPDGDYVGPTGSDLDTPIEPGSIPQEYLIESSSSSEPEFVGPGPDTEEELRQRDLRRKKKKEKEKPAFSAVNILANLVEPPVLPQGVVGDVAERIDRLPGPPVSSPRTVAKEKADEVIRQRQDDAKAKRLATRKRAEERREQQLQQDKLEAQKQQEEIDKAVGAERQAKSLLKHGVAFEKEDISSEEKGDEKILAEKKLVGKQKKVNTKQLDEAKEKLKKNQEKKAKKGGKQTAKESKDEKILTKKIADLEKRRDEQQKKLDEIEAKIQQAPAFDIEGTFGIETETETETSEGGRKLGIFKDTGLQKKRVKPVYIQTAEQLKQRLEKKVERGDRYSSALGGNFDPESQDDYTNYFYHQYHKQYTDNLDMDPNNPINKKKRKIKEAEDEYVIEQAERDGVDLEQGATSYPYEVWKKYSVEFRKKLKPEDRKILEAHTPFKTTGLVAGPVLTQVQRLRQEQQKQKAINMDLKRRQKYYGEQLEFVDEQQVGKVVFNTASSYVGKKARQARYTPEQTEKYRGEGGFGRRITQNISDIGGVGNPERQLAQSVFETERRKEVEGKKYKLLLDAGLSEADAKTQSQNISSVDYDAIGISSGEESRLQSKIDDATKQYRKSQSEQKRLKKAKSKKDKELFGKSESDYEKEFRKETKGLYGISPENFYQRRAEFDKQKQARAERRRQEFLKLEQQPVEPVGSEESEGGEATEESEEAQAPLDEAVVDAVGDDFEVED